MNISSLNKLVPAENRIPLVPRRPEGIQVQYERSQHLNDGNPDEGRDSDIENTWDEEIERRVKEIENGTAKGRPAEAVLSEIRANYSCRS